MQKKVHWHDVASTSTPELPTMLFQTDRLSTLFHALHLTISGKLWIIHSYSFCLLILFTHSSLYYFSDNWFYPDFSGYKKLRYRHHWVSICRRYGCKVSSKIYDCTRNHGEHRWEIKQGRYSSFALRWRHNERDSVSNHQPHDCLLNRLFRRRSKKTSKLRVTGLCAGNSPGTGEFPAHMASYAENVSIWWRHHGLIMICYHPE